LSDILASIPHKKSAASVSQSQSDSQPKTSSGMPIYTASRRKAQKDGLDPNKRYLSVNVIKGSAFVDFVNVRQDEHIQIAVSFLKTRVMTQKAGCSTDPVFDETFVFDMQGEEEMKFDAAMLLKLN
jgi:hypothetical protein